MKTRPHTLTRKGCLAMIVLAAMALSCRTTEPPPEPVETVEGPNEFQPLSYVSTLDAAAGKYPDLYLPSSCAVWVDANVTKMKSAEQAKAGMAPSPLLERDAQVILEDYLVIECHVESAFADTSIAYDAVRFHRVDIYLELPDGQRMKPIQVIIDSDMEEEQQGALRLFRRANIVVFPKTNLLTGRPLIPKGTPAVRLVLEAYDSTFHFEWPCLNPDLEPKWKPAAEETQRILKLGFTELYTRIRRLAHRFD